MKKYQSTPDNRFLPDYAKVSPYPLDRGLLMGDPQPHRVKILESFKVISEEVKIERS